MSDFLLPDLGEGLTEATIVAWHVAVGDEVTRISQDFYFGNTDAADAAQQILTALEGMQPAS